MSSLSSVGAGGSGPVTDAVLTLKGNTGGAVGPDGAGNITVEGDGTVIVASGNPGTNTITIDIETATTSLEGAVFLATDAEAIAGTDTANAVTSTALKAKLGTQTQYSVAIGDGTNMALGWSNTGTTGQILVAESGGVPAFSTVTSSDNTILINSTGPNNLNLRASGGAGSGISVVTDNGTATPAANILNLNGAVSGNITVTAPGSSNNLVVAVSGTTNHEVQVGNASGSLTSIAVGAANTVLLGTGADPSFGAVPNAALAHSTISFTDGNSINISPSGPVALGSGVTIGVSGTTPHAVQVGATIGGLSNISVGAANTVLLGTGVDPAFGKVPNAALVNNSITVTGDVNITPTGSPVALGGTLGLSLPTFTQYQVTTAGAGGALQSLGSVGTSGQVLTSQGAAMQPTWANGATVINGSWTPQINFTGFSVAPTYTSSGFYTQTGGSIGSVTIYGVINVTNFGVAPAGSALNVLGYPTPGNCIGSFLASVVTNVPINTIYNWQLVGVGGTHMIAYAAINSPSSAIAWSNFGMGATNYIFYFTNTYLFV